MLLTDDKTSMERMTSQCAHWWCWFCQWIEFESERCTRVTEPHAKFHERQELITLWYNVPFVKFEVEMLEVSCARTHCYKLCVAPNAHKNMDIQPSRIGIGYLVHP